MSVYIPGRAMPKRCDECFIVSPDDGYITWYCTLAEEEVTENCLSHKRSENCPLIHVPDHGRLIDADVLRSQCDDPYWCVWMSEIDDSPTIIPGDKEESTNE